MTDVERALITVNGLLHAGQTSIDDIAAAAGDTRYWPDSLTTHIVIRLANGRSESAAESRFSSLCYAQHLPRPEPQVEVRDETGHVFARVDFAWPELMAFVEIDGSLKYRVHRRPGETLEEYLMREKRREEKICLLTGWICIRVTWADLERPEQLAARIRRLLASRASSSPA
ncbi:MAG: hypothetical protein ACR2K3_01295 [Nocardioides sp.]